MITGFGNFGAMTAALEIQRFISTAQSAIKGGLLCSRSIMFYISEVAFHARSVRVCGFWVLLAPFAFDSRARAQDGQALKPVFGDRWLTYL